MLGGRGGGCIHEWKGEVPDAEVLSLVHSFCSVFGFDSQVAVVAVHEGGCWMMNNWWV